MTTARELIGQLTKLEDLDLPVYGVHGASGSSYTIGFPSIQKADMHEQGDTLDLKLGEKYIMLYIGN